MSGEKRIHKISQGFLPEEIADIRRNYADYRRALGRILLAIDHDDAEEFIAANYEASACLRIFVQDVERIEDRLGIRKAREALQAHAKNASLN